MALTSYINWRVTTGGTEANGGGFDPSLTTNMLTDGAATSATGASPVFSSASYNFVAGDVGAYLYIASGTNWTPGWYPIVSVAANAATLDADVTTNRGGALLANKTVLTTTGCATTASPTGATFSIDYTPLNTAPVSASDLTSTASTTMTSATGGFTKVMIGNTVKLTSGSGTTPGYYSITNRTDTNTITVDRSSGTYTAGVFKVGGAHASLVNYSNSGTGLPTPAVATPLAAGHTIWMKGAGNENPSASDYDYDAGYWTFPAGSSTAGWIKIIGYNGRPQIDYSGLLIYNSAYFHILYLCPKQNAATSTTYGFLSSGRSVASHCRFDQNGYDAVQHAGAAFDCYFKNGGSTTAGTAYAWTGTNQYPSILIGNVFENIRGGAIRDASGLSYIANNIIRNCKGTATAGILLDASTYGSIIYGNTIDNGAGDAIRLSDADVIASTVIRNNIISNHAGSGKFGINCSVGTTALNDALIIDKIDYNDLYANTTDRNNHSAGIHDKAVDPTYTDSASGDYSIGTNLKESGFPNTFPNGASTAYIDIGGVQRQEPAGGSGGLNAFGFAQ